MWEGEHHPSTRRNGEDPRPESRVRWPRYKSLQERGGKIRTAVDRDKKGELFPPWYSQEIDAPLKTRNAKGEEAGNWDLEHGDNFQVKCYRPYWHEANHIIPNSTLQKAIAEVGKGMHSPGRVRLVVRGRLLEARYNLNHKDNMILLPMDAEVARALRLPRHRSTAFLRSHRAYNENVYNELLDIFSELKEQLRKHSSPKPDYGQYKAALVELSSRLYGQIIAAAEEDGAGALDEMEPGRFKRPARQPKKQDMSADDF